MSVATRIYLYLHHWIINRRKVCGDKNSLSITSRN